MAERWPPCGGNAKARTAAGLYVRARRTCGQDAVRGASTQLRRELAVAAAPAAPCFRGAFRSVACRAIPVIFLDLKPHQTAEVTLVFAVGVDLGNGGAVWAGPRLSVGHGGHSCRAMRWASPCLWASAAPIRRYPAERAGVLIFDLMEAAGVLPAQTRAIASRLPTLQLARAFTVDWPAPTSFSRTRLLWDLVQLTPTPLWSVAVRDEPRQERMGGAGEFRPGEAPQAVDRRRESAGWTGSGGTSGGDHCPRGAVRSVPLSVHG
ncbi:hypothetical protein GA0115243_102167 [Streptomyces sp. ScaeMP-e83]|nr:hypothetical protein GA0115243_102167 [Streptomyces sp. ScaeMP-e83]